MTQVDQGVLDTAIRAAREGGRVALQHLGEPLAVRWKGLRDPLPSATVWVQDAIFDAIRSAFPHDTLLGEEGEEDEPLPLYADRLWVVDPIDGSLNYFHGIPFFAVSIAFRRAGRYEVGVVYDPFRDELFQGCLDGGAWLNDRPLRLDQQAPPGASATPSSVGTDWPGGSEARTAALLAAGELLKQGTSIAVMGSPALGLCYTAAGRFDAYCHLNLLLWDVAGAAVVIREAGGMLTDARGGAWEGSDGTYAAGSAAWHPWLIDALQPLFPARSALRSDDS